MYYVPIKYQDYVNNQWLILMGLALSRYPGRNFKLYNLAG
jgi:hypothetical protein